MCGRYAIDINPKKFAEHFHVAGDHDLIPSWNIAPSTKVYTLTEKDAVRHLNRMKWGLIPSWAEDVSIGNKLSNARGESVADKPSFRSAFKYHRCLIPASGYFEWKTENGIKFPWYISLKSGEPMAFAGLWETWHKGGNESVESCCIITTSANALMEPIHNRMPVILPRECWEIWLSPHEHQKADLLPMISPFNPALMQAWEVTRELNKTGFRDDAGLIERVT